MDSHREKTFTDRVFCSSWLPLGSQRRHSHRTCLSARMADFTMPMQPVGIVGGGGGSGGSMGADYGTLDEPVTETIMRDVRMVGNKMMCVLNPRKANIQTLKDWDLWGPLILCLMLATLLSWFAPYEQKSLVFASVFVIVWCGAAVVTVNALLLGGNISFFQSVCVLGYCIFPLNIASIVCLVGGPFFWRILVVAICFFWSTGASLGAPPAMAPAADGPLHARAHDPPCCDLCPSAHPCSRVLPVQASWASSCRPTAKRSPCIRSFSFTQQSAG